MEELYYLKFDRPAGFAIGGVYHDLDDREGSAQLSMVGDGQIFDVPRGYHFIAPCPGYRLRYTWALAGSHRQFGAWVTDPAYAWMTEFQDE